MFKLATWNVNSIKVRLDQVLEWLESTQTHVLALQETKVMDDNFPKSAFLEKGYHLAFAGQSTYNGVALISRLPVTDILTDPPDFIDPQRRILAATIAGLRFINLYVPNGASPDSEKYLYKLQWLEKITAFVQHQLTLYPQVIVLGDFNIAPEDADVHDPAEWVGCVLVSPAERLAFFKLLQSGLYDSFRNFTQEEKTFSWWDYRAASFRRNRGLRIDHILLSKTLNPLCKQAQIDTKPREALRPSDHAPMWVELNLKLMALG